MLAPIEAKVRSPHFELRMLNVERLLLTSKFSLLDSYLLSKGNP